MQLDMYNVKNSFGSSTAFASRLINSKEQRDSSMFTNFSKYLNKIYYYAIYGLRCNLINIFAAMVGFFSTKSWNVYGETPQL